MVIRLILNVERGRKLVRQKTVEAGKRRGRMDKKIGTIGSDWTTVLGFPKTVY